MGRRRYPSMRNLRLPRVSAEPKLESRFGRSEVYLQPRNRPQLFFARPRLTGDHVSDPGIAMKPPRLPASAPVSRRAAPPQRGNRVRWRDRRLYFQKAARSREDMDQQPAASENGRQQ